MHSISTSVPSGSSLTATQVRACCWSVECDLSAARSITYRQRLLKELLVTLVHCLKVLHARNVDIDFNDVLQTRAGSFKHGR